MIRALLLAVVVPALPSSLMLLGGVAPPGGEGKAGALRSDVAQPAAPARAREQRVSVVLTPRHRAILSARVSSRVLKIHKELGQSFQAGEVLVQLDDLTYRVNRNLAEAELTAAEGTLAEVQRLTAARTRQRRAEAVLAAAQVNLAATQRLFDDGHASQLDLENARRDVATAQAEVELVQATAARELLVAQRELEVARGRKEIATDELEACTLPAPYAGRVARVLVSEHEWVERGRPVIEVVDDRVLLAKFLLPSALFRAVRLGQELELTISETGQTTSMKVSHIAAVLEPASVTFEVYAEVDNADGNLRAGMNGSLNLANFAER